MPPLVSLGAVQEMSRSVHHLVLLFAGTVAGVSSLVLRGDGSVFCPSGRAC